MAKSAMPVILLAGGAALLLGGKKKKNKKKSDLPGPDSFDEYDDGFVIPDPSPRPGAGSSKRPSGNPPRGDNYDGDYWGSTSEERLTTIRQYFKDLGYPVEVGPWPMNRLGPKGEVELENKDGSKGKLGGDDDEKSAVVERFQKEYNIVSRLNKAEKVYPQNLGGLATDGLFGPYTLNALRFAHDEKPGDKAWPDLIQMASLKGIT